MTASSITVTDQHTIISLESAETLPRSIATTSSHLPVGQPPLGQGTEAGDFNSSEYRSSLYKRTNFRPEERDILIDLIEGYVDIIENRKGGYGPRDPNSNLMKDQAWQEIALRFNNHADFVKRDASQLRKCWMNMKARSQFTQSQRRRLGLDVGDRNMTRKKARRRPVSDGIRLLSFSNPRRPASGRATMLPHSRLAKSRQRLRQSRSHRDPSSTALSSRPTQLYNLLDNISNPSYSNEGRGSIVEYASGSAEPATSVEITMNNERPKEVASSARMRRVAEDGGAVEVQRVITSPSSQVSYLARELSLPRVEIHRPSGLRNAAQRIAVNSSGNRRQTTEKVPQGILQIQQYSQPVRQQVNSSQYGFVHEGTPSRTDSTQKVSSNSVEAFQRVSPNHLEGALRDALHLKRTSEEVSHEGRQRIFEKSHDGNERPTGESVFIWETMENSENVPKITNVTSITDVKAKSEPAVIGDDVLHESEESHKTLTTEAHTQTRQFSEVLGHSTLSTNESKAIDMKSTSERNGSENSRSTAENMREPEVERETNMEDERFEFPHDFDHHEQNSDEINANVQYEDEVLYVDDDDNGNDDGFIGLATEEGDDEDGGDDEGDENRTQRDSSECDGENRARGYTHDMFAEEERKARIEILYFEVEKAKEEAKAAKHRRELLEMEVESAREQRDLHKRRQEAEIELILERQRYEKSRIDDLVSSRRVKSKMMDTAEDIQQNGLM